MTTLKHRPQSMPPPPKGSNANASPSPAPSRSSMFCVPTSSSTSAQVQAHAPAHDAASAAFPASPARVAIVWFKPTDLRLHDHEPFARAHNYYPSASSSPSPPAPLSRSSASFTPATTVISAPSSSTSPQLFARSTRSTPASTTRQLFSPSTPLSPHSSSTAPFGSPVGSPFAPTTAPSTSSSLPPYTHVVHLCVLDPQMWSADAKTLVFGFPRTGARKAQHVLDGVADLHASLAQRGAQLYTSIGEPQTVVPSVVRAVLHAMPAGTSVDVLAHTDWLTDESTHHELTTNRLQAIAEAMAKANASASTSANSNASANARNAVPRRASVSGGSSTLAPGSTTSTISTSTVRLLPFWGNTMVHRDESPVAIDELPASFADFYDLMVHKRGVLEHADLFRPLRLFTVPTTHTLLAPPAPFAPLDQCIGGEPVVISGKAYASSRASSVVAMPRASSSSSNASEAAGVGATSPSLIRLDRNVPTLEDLHFSREQAAAARTVHMLSAIGFAGGESRALRRLAELTAQWAQPSSDKLSSSSSTMAKTSPRSPYSTLLLYKDASSKLSPYLATGALSALMVLRAAADALAIAQHHAPPQPSSATTSNNNNNNTCNFTTSLTTNRAVHSVVRGVLQRDFTRLYALRHGRRLFYRYGVRGRDDVWGNTDLLQPQWKTDDALVRAWTEARTGHDFVDALVTELVTTGYLSRRGREVVASFLVKDMGVDWRVGAEFFEAVLVDFDAATNYAGWTSVAGVHADASAGLYLSVDKQQRDHDPALEYTRAWLACAATQRPRECAPCCPQRFGVDADHDSVVVGGGVGGGGGEGGGSASAGAVDDGPSDTAARVIPPTLFTPPSFSLLRKLSSGVASGGASSSSSSSSSPVAQPTVSPLAAGAPIPRLAFSPPGGNRRGSQMSSNVAVSSPPATTATTATTTTVPASGSFRSPPHAQPHAQAHAQPLHPPKHSRARSSASIAPMPMPMPMPVRLVSSSETETEAETADISSKTLQQQQEQKQKQHAH